MHPRLSISAVSSWRWSFEQDLEFWAKTGIDHVGLSLRKLEEHGLEAAIQAVREAGLRVSNLVELGWFELSRPESWTPQRERVERALFAAERVGARCLAIPTGPAGGLEWDGAAAALGEAWAPLLPAARAAGVAVAFENTSSLRLDLSFLTTLRDTVDLARRLDVAVCAELNSCFAERDLAATCRDAGERLCHVQISDLHVGSLSTPDRAVPGDGDIPLDRVVGQLLAAGYRGAFELEMVGPRIEAEGYATAIRRSVDFLDRLLDRSGA